MSTKEHNQTGNDHIREIRERIRTWLVTDGWTFGGARSDPEAAWVFIAQNPLEHYITFRQARNRYQFYPHIE